MRSRGRGSLTGIEIAPSTAAVVRSSRRVLFRPRGEVVTSKQADDDVDLENRRTLDSAGVEERDGGPPSA